MDLIFVSCGQGFVVAFFVTEVVLILGAIYLLWSRRHQHELGAYLPVTIIPLFLGGLRSMITLSTAVGLMRNVDANSTIQADGIMLLGMSALPLLLGVVLTLPAFSLVALGRTVLLWSANREFPVVKPIVNKKSPNSATNGDRDLSATEDYISQLTRYRD